MHAASAKGNEQKSVEESEKGRGPVLLDCNSGTVDRMVEITKGTRSSLSSCQKEGSDVEVERKSRDTWRQLVGS